MNYEVKYDSIRRATQEFDTPYYCKWQVEIFVGSKKETAIFSSYSDAISFVIMKNPSHLIFYGLKADKKELFTQRKK